MMPIRDIIRRVRWHVQAAFATPASDAPCRWVRRSIAFDGQRIVLFVTYAPQGRITANARHQIAAWQREGFQVVSIVAVDDLHRAADDTYSGDQVLVRLNVGYDFGAWASAITMMPGIDRAALIVIANDSVYGPTTDFAVMLQRVAESRADVIGVTESYEQTHHLQSYLLFFKPAALRHPIFLRFWRSVRSGSRQHVIDLYETALTRRFKRAGLAVEALFPTDPAFSGNRTLTEWGELLAEGFPFIKAQLVRENPFGADIDGWADRLAQRGYDSGIATADLARRAMSK